MGRTLTRAVLISIALTSLHARPLLAQPWVGWAVPDSVLDAVLDGARAGHENTWNALLVAELRAGLARADSAARLAALERRVAGVMMRDT